MSNFEAERLKEPDDMSEAVLRGDAEAFTEAYKASRIGFIVNKEVILVKYWADLGGADLVYDLQTEVFRRQDLFQVRDDLWKERDAKEENEVFTSQSELGADAEGGPEDRVQRTMHRFSVEVALRLGLLLSAEGMIHEG